MGPRVWRSTRAEISFQADGSNNIYKFTPNGTQSTFASGLNSPAGLAFNSSGDLFEADWESRQHL